MAELTMSFHSEMTAPGSLRSSQQITEVDVGRAAVTDIVTVASDPKVHAQIGALFRRFGWCLAPLRSGAAAINFTSDNLAAVALCEEKLPDGTWRDLAAAFNAQPYSPSLIVIAEDKSLVSEVAQQGGFDVLTRPFNQADVLWAVASAWHAWMTKYERLHELSSRV